MDKESAEIIAAALHSIAASNAINAETNVILASKLDELANTVRGAQARVDRQLGDAIRRSKETAERLMKEAQNVADAR